MDILPIESVLYYRRSPLFVLELVVRYGWQVILDNCHVAYDGPVADVIEH